MRIVDANVLLYAVNEDAPHHSPARQWLDDSLSGAATVGFSWIALLAFLRLSTKHGLFPRPLPTAQAVEQAQAWLSATSAMVVEPTGQHLNVVAGLLGAVGVGGNMVNDAHLAALAIEHRGQVVSFDHDFRRFPGVALVVPGE